MSPCGHAAMRPCGHAQQPRRGHVQLPWGQLRRRATRRPGRHHQQKKAGTTCQPSGCQASWRACCLIAARHLHLTAAVSVVAARCCGKGRARREHEGNDCQQFFHVDPWLNEWERSVQPSCHGGRQMSSDLLSGITKAVAGLAGSSATNPCERAIAGKVRGSHAQLAITHGASPHRPSQQSSGRGAAAYAVWTANNKASTTPSRTRIRKG
jgi:hypothetical protein